MVATAELRAKNVPRKDVETQTDFDRAYSLRPVAIVYPVIREEEYPPDLC